MAFYIQPPEKGNIALATLETFCIKRLRFLIEIAGCHGNAMKIRDVCQSVAMVTESDCLMEGTTKDQISHFMLRLACCGDDEISRFFERAEANLFSYRMSCLREDEVYRCLRPLRKFIATAAKSKEVLSTPMQDIFNFTSQLRKHGPWKDLVHKYSTGDSGCIEVQFQFVPDLVATRSVVLRRGWALVPCHMLPSLLLQIFHMFLKTGLAQAKKLLPDKLSDVRISRLIRRVKMAFNSSRPTHINTGGSLRVQEIDEVSKYFPPCMQHLHQQLITKHRLRHHARIQYTLFLKEIGLPLNEALQFWRQEYSKPSCYHGNGSCDHSWDRDWKRYTYNIRHLYGLEGGRKNYRAHCCQSLQTKVMAVGEDGGCPFKHFDEDHLKSKLKVDELNSNRIDHIVSIATKGGYQQACIQHFNEKVNSFSQSLSCRKKVHKKGKYPNKGSLCQSAGLTKDDSGFSLEESELNITGAMKDRKCIHSAASTQKMNTFSEDSFVRPFQNTKEEKSLNISHLTDGILCKQQSGDSGIFTPDEEQSFRIPTSTTTKVNKGHHCVKGQSCDQGQVHLEPSVMSGTFASTIRQSCKDLLNDTGQGHSFVKGQGHSDSFLEPSEKCPPKRVKQEEDEWNKYKVNISPKIVCSDICHCRHAEQGSFSNICTKTKLFSKGLDIQQGQVRSGLFEKSVTADTQNCSMLGSPSLCVDKTDHQLMEDLVSVKGQGQAGSCDTRQFEGHDKTASPAVGKTWVKVHRKKLFKTIKTGVSINSCAPSHSKHPLETSHNSHYDDKDSPPLMLESKHAVKRKLSEIIQDHKNVPGALSLSKCNKDEVKVNQRTNQGDEQAENGVEELILSRSNMSKYCEVLGPRLAVQHGLVNVSSGGNSRGEDSPEMQCTVHESGKKIHLPASDRSVNISLSGNCDGGSVKDNTVCQEERIDHTDNITGCFDHDACLASQAPPEEKLSSSLQVNIYKPSDYYFSFMNLVKQLRN